jgi:glycosyltransferase domain-containing protein
MKQLSKDLTIVLVLKDRAPFTWRWMKYYNQVGLPYKVLIADGGKDQLVEKLADTSLYPNLDYEYIRYPYDKDIPTFLNKLQAVMARVDTPYTLLTDNDDFFFADGLQKAADFLNANQDYFASRGEIYDFLIRSKDSDVYGKITGFKKSFPAPTNTKDTVLGRVREFSEFSDDLAHDVCRTEGLRKTCQILANSHITDLQLSDNLMDYLLVTYGKVHRDTGLFMLHQCHTGGLGRTLFKSNPFEWILSATWPEDLSQMCRLIALEISNGDGVHLEYAYNRVMQYYISFIVAKNIVQGRTETKIAQRPPRVVTWGRIFNKNNPIRKFFKKLYTLIREWRLQMRSDNSVSSSPYKKEMAKIQEFLLQNRNGLHT